MMTIIETGKPFEPMIGRREGVIFDADDSGFLLIYNFASPNAKEIVAVQQDQPFEIRFVTLGGIIWILTKAGSLEWTDAPYVPQLTQAASIVHPGDGEGIALTFLITDAPSGVVKHARLIGLGTKFSNALLSEIEAVGAQPFDPVTYANSLTQTMQKYSTRDMARMATSRWALK